MGNELETLSNGHEPTGTISGDVRSTFLGPVTSLGVNTGIGMMMVDVASTRALMLGSGSRVALRWDLEAPQVLPISAPASPAAYSSSRSS
jgi:hypothetical protein